MNEIPTILDTLLVERLGTHDGAGTAAAGPQSDRQPRRRPSPAGGAPGGSAPSGSGPAAPPPPDDHHHDARFQPALWAPRSHRARLYPRIGHVQSGSSSGLGGLLSQHVTPTKKQPGDGQRWPSQAGGAHVTERARRPASSRPFRPAPVAPAPAARAVCWRDGSTTWGVGSDAPGAAAVGWFAGATIAAVTLAGCSGGPGSPQRTATAVFSDVGDLANGAQVQMADVPVGSVSSIALDGDKAKVTLALRHRACASRPTSPRPSTAPPSSATSSSSSSCPRAKTAPPGTTSPQLANGAVIAHTSIVPDVEQFVGAGAQVFGAISTTELEQIIAAGGQGFTGQEASLKAFLNDSADVAAGYAQHTSDITQAVNGLQQPDVDRWRPRAAPPRPP